VVAYRLAAVARGLGRAEASRSYAEDALVSGLHTGTRTTIALAQLAHARLDLDANALGDAATRLVAALEQLDVAADRWVLAEALEATGRLQVARGLPARTLLEQAAGLRELIGQPPPPTDVVELAAVTEQAAANSAGGDEDPIAGVADPAGLRAWALDLCWSVGPGSDASSALRPS
jgi:hypothetical protein